MLAHDGLSAGFDNRCGAAVCRGISNDIAAKMRELSPQRRGDQITPFLADIKIHQDNLRLFGGGTSIRAMNKLEDW